jgi:hypothetical protein
MPKTPRETFWATIAYAWKLVGDRGARRALRRATSTLELERAAAVITARLPFMLKTLAHMLDSYTSPQLLAWSRECKAAVAELDRPSLHPVLGDRDGLQVLFNAAWIVAAGERVRSALFANPEAWRPLRGRIGCSGLLLLAWSMHRDKFGPLPVPITRYVRGKDVEVSDGRERARVGGCALPTPGDVASRNVTAGGVAVVSGGERVTLGALDDYAYDMRSTVACGGCDE